jgi:hypothetical protein
MLFVHHGIADKNCLIHGEVEMVEDDGQILSSVGMVVVRLVLIAV